MKTCCDCALPKATEEFYLSSKGRPACVCKECHKARMKHRRLTNPLVQEYDRLRAKTPKRKEIAKRVRVQWRAAHPDAYKAHIAVGNAVRDGKLKKQPCAICGVGDHVHAHHQDYSKPLAVKWLCAKCHHRVHATFPELGGHHEATP
jgi:hypothetical protein